MIGVCGEAISFLRKSIDITMQLQCFYVAITMLLRCNNIEIAS